MKNVELLGSLSQYYHSVPQSHRRTCMNVTYHVRPPNSHNRCRILHCFLYRCSREEKIQHCKTLGKINKVHVGIKRDCLLAKLLAMLISFSRPSFDARFTSSVNTEYSIQLTFEMNVNSCGMRMTCFSTSCSAKMVLSALWSVGFVSKSETRCGACCQLVDLGGDSSKAYARIVEE